MDWKTLLSEERVRELDGGAPSVASDTEARTQLSRDYGRAVFSTPVRRLQDKTQVFPLERIDGVRTRLTHSMEVSSMARGLASGICEDLIKINEIDHFEAIGIETIAATCGLLHDVGNPPFGHSGEQSIRNWFKNKEKENPLFFETINNGNNSLKQDFLNFEGNAQTIRLVMQLQILSDKYGLNLTAATVSALQKYTADSSNFKIPDKHSKSKPGYFQTEKKYIELVQAETQTNGLRNPITSIVEAADDMTYAPVDIEDAIKKGLINWGDLKTELQDCEKAVKLFTNVEKKIKTLSGGKQKDESLAQLFRTYLATDASTAVRIVFSENYDAIMAGEYDKELLYESEVCDVFKNLKKFAVKKVYSSGEVLKLELLGDKVISSLLDIFWDVNPSSNRCKLFGLMSTNYISVYKEAIKVSDFSDSYHRAMLITDYISGMTDSFALNLYKELNYGF